MAINNLLKEGEIERERETDRQIKKRVKYKYHLNLNLSFKFINQGKLLTKFFIISKRLVVVV